MRAQCYTKGVKRREEVQTVVLRLGRRGTMTGLEKRLPLFTVRSTIAPVLSGGSSIGIEWVLRGSPRKEGGARYLSAKEN